MTLEEFIHTWKTLGSAPRLHDTMNLENLIENFHAWGAERRLHDTIDLLPQLAKLGEEYGELCAGVARNDERQIMDAVGDMIVVLTQLGAVADTRFMRDVDGQYLNRAALHAWEQIKVRTGKTVDGVFLKDIAYIT